MLRSYIENNPLQKSNLSRSPQRMPNTTQLISTTQDHFQKPDQQFYLKKEQENIALKEKYMQTGLSNRPNQNFTTENKEKFTVKNNQCDFNPSIGDYDLKNLTNRSISPINDYRTSYLEQSKFTKDNIGIPSELRQFERRIMENSKILSNTDYRRNFTPCKGDRENITPNKDNLKLIPNLSIGTTMNKMQFTEKKPNVHDNYCYKKFTEDNFPKYNEYQQNMETNYNNTYKQHVLQKTKSQNQLSSSQVSSHINNIRNNYKMDNIKSTNQEHFQKPDQIVYQKYEQQQQNLKEKYGYDPLVIRPNNSFITENKEQYQQKNNESEFNPEIGDYDLKNMNNRGQNNKVDIKTTYQQLGKDVKENIGVPQELRQFERKIGDNRFNNNSEYQRTFTPQRADRENISPIKDNLKLIPNLSIGSTMYKQHYTKKQTDNHNIDYTLKKHTEDSFPRFRNNQ